MTNKLTTEEFPSDLNDESYRAISRFVPLSVVFGVASSLALIHPLLWLIPLATVILAVIGLRQIAGNPELIGRKSILFGLVCGCFFGTLAPVHVLTHNHLLSREARRVASDWLELIRQDRMQEAHQWMLEPSQRKGSFSPPQDHSESKSPEDEGLNRFLSETPVNSFRDKIVNSSLHFDGRQDFSVLDEVSFVVHRFVVVSESSDTTSDWTFQVTVKRTTHRNTGEAYWTIEHLREA